MFVLSRLSLVKNVPTFGNYVKSFPKFSMFFKVDPEDVRHGGQLVAQTLKDHNVTCIFTLIGGHISPIIVGAEQLGIRIIDTRHEVTAVFAADAFARLSGTIGVAAVTAGPGVTNTLTAVKNAQMAETPLLLLGGAAATLLKGRGALQDIDQLSLFKSVCKFSKSITCVRDIIPTLRKAIHVAYSGTPGPVFVELPLDVLYPYKLVRQEMKIPEKPKGIGQKLTSMFLKSYLHYQFAGAFNSQDTFPLPASYPFASDNEVEKCRELLSKSERPIILLGSQAVIPPKYATNLRNALESLKIPCYLGGMSRGLLGKNCTLHMRHKRREALQMADLVILAGSVCDFRLSYGRILKRSSSIVAINMDKEQLQKNSGIFWTPTLSIKALPADFLIRLAQKNMQLSYDNWLQQLRERDDEHDRNNRMKSQETKDNYINPVNLLFKLEDHLPEKTILVADGGDFVATASYILRARGPLMWLDPGAFGTLGVGAGFALGAKLCYPDHTVLILYGDGSCGYSIVEFDTFARHKIPVIALVGNDACWTQIAREQVPMFQSDAACNLDYSAYHHVAEAFGAKGYILNTENKNKIDEVLKKALLDLNESNKSVLINAHIGKTDFRAGSISI